MNAERLVRELTKYRDELEEIKRWFSITPGGERRIKREDDPRFRQIVIELRDLLNDSLGENEYSLNILHRYNPGVANVFESPSFESVEGIATIVSSVITRIKRQGKLPIARQPEEPGSQPKADLILPEKVTMSWLARHVPVKFWFWLVGLLIAAFALGVKTGQIPVVQQWFR